MAEPSPAAASERCSVLSVQRGEAMLGSAFTQPGVLLVEQPGPWGPAGLSASHFDPAIAAALEARAEDAGLRLLAVRRPGRTATDATRRWAVAFDGVVSWSRFERDAELLDVALDGTAGERDEAPLYLVCAHSKRDVCCALRGRPLASELEALRPGRVWECSHTGGHRFAPNVLVLPAGALYGRIPADGAPALVAASERDELLPPLLRGLIGYPPVVQVALGHALVRLGERTAEALAVIDVHEQGDGQWAVRLAHAGAHYAVRLSAETVPTPFSSCAKPDPKPQTQITPVEMIAL